MIVVCGGWGLIALALYLTRNGTQDVFLIIGVAAAISLIFFLGMEYKQLLTRLTGLRPFSADPFGVKSGLFFWLTGVPGLMFRSSATDDVATETELRPTAAEPHQTDGVREIIETIVFVVVLVLLLKSFAAEAFVIPTGSMAETLYGYQQDIIKCPQCGLEFPVNCSQEVDPQPGNGTEPPKPVLITGCTCPACRYNIDFQAEEQKNPGWKEPGWNSGDRVLVAKFLYELFNKRPNRLDVVVFKYPGDSHTGNLFPRSGPIKNQTPMNYIKRLIGLPGETIAIHRGNLYVLPPGSGVEFNDWKEAQTNEELRLKLWQWQYMHVDDPEARRFFSRKSSRLFGAPGNDPGETPHRLQQRSSGAGSQERGFPRTLGRRETVEVEREGHRLSN